MGTVQKICFWVWVSLGPTGIMIAAAGNILQSRTLMVIGIGLTLTFFIPLVLSAGASIITSRTGKEKSAK